MLCPNEKTVLDKLVSTGNIGKWQELDEYRIEITFLDGTIVEFGVNADQVGNPVFDIDERL